MARDHAIAESFFQVADRAVSDCLRAGRSLIAPDRIVWERQYLDDLRNRVVEQLDFSNAEFSAKLAGQLAGAGFETILVAADLLYLLLLTQGQGSRSKRQVLDPILGVASPPLALDDELTAGLSHGIASYGAALAHRYWQYVFLIEFSSRWAALEQETKNELLADADRFYEVVVGLPDKGASSQREALLYIAFPDVFEPIISTTHQDQIIAAFQQDAGDSSLPRYKRLSLIRSALTPKHGQDFDFYDDALRSIWGRTSPRRQPRLDPDSPLHLLVKWSARYGSDTVAKHLEVARSEGVVWWGILGKPGRPKVSASRLQELRQQLSDNIETFVYLVGPTCWRTKLNAITTSREDVDVSRVPAYYDPATDHAMWIELSDFDEIDRDWLMDHLYLARKGMPLSSRSLGNQQNPLLVRESEPQARTTWWVCQGATFAEERDLGVLWAPKEGKNGVRREFWRALEDAKVGDTVLHYANGAIRAVSTITRAAIDAPKPAGLSGEWELDGWLAEAAYRELPQPVGLEQISHESRVKEGAPFTKDGSVQQGYFFKLSEPFVDVLGKAFPQLGLHHRPEEVPPGGPSVAFDLDGLRGMVAAAELALDDALLVQILSALESGKHIILTGPPGTAKTTLAQLVAEFARRAGRCRGYVPTTATSDWTTYETIGGLRPSADGTLIFQPGHFLSAIEENEWLVIDELNRSNFDRAFGQLFTVLSDQTVVLPYERGKGSGPIALVPGSRTRPVGNFDVVTVPKTWRIIATMNVFDKTLLFEMSYALMRRFAFIEVPSPGRERFEQLIAGWAGGDVVAQTVAEQLLAVREVKDVGPAAFRDIARYVKARRGLDGAAEGQLVFEAFYSFLLPQFEGIDDEEGRRLRDALSPALEANDRLRLVATLNTVLGLEVPRPRSGFAGDGDIEDDEPADSAAI